MEILRDITINVKQSGNILCKNIFASFHKIIKDLLFRQNTLESEGQGKGKIQGMCEEH